MKYITRSALYAHHARRELARLRGETLPAVGAHLQDSSTCQRCGYHVCSCKEVTIKMPAIYNCGGNDPSLSVGRLERPAVCTVHSWDVAEADMIAHPGARWACVVIPDDCRRFAQGHFQWRCVNRGWQRWICPQDALCFSWRRLPDNASNKG